MGSTVILRDPEGFSKEEYDLVVVGGGIQGVALFLEAAERGMRVLLLERQDFGAGASWNSLRILHGGLRYLQTADLVRFVESVRARRWFFRRFPSLVRPLPCKMPLTGQGLKRPSILRVALGLNDLLSADRNSGVDRSIHLSRGRVVTATPELAGLLGLDGKRRIPLASWNDGLMLDPPQLLMSMLRGGCAAGGHALNYCEAIEIRSESGRVSGVVVRDGVSGNEFSVGAHRVVLCAGADPRDLAPLSGIDSTSLPPPSLAFNVVIRRRLPTPDAIALDVPARAGQTFFLYPLGPLTLAGTVHGSFSPEEPMTPDGPDVERLIQDLSDALPGWPVSSTDVVRTLAGVLPATVPGETELAKRPAVIAHAPLTGVSGIYSVVAIKYTTAPTVASRILSTIVEPPLPKRRPSAAFAPKPSLSQFLEIVSRDPSEAATLVQTIREQESVVRVEDLVYRRVDWGLDPERAEEVLDWLRGRIEVHP